MDVFLRLNGVRLVVGAGRAAREILSLYDTGQFEFKNLESWIKCYARSARNQQPITESDPD
jgi:prophage maintenance system killer protein